MFEALYHDFSCVCLVVSISLVAIDDALYRELLPAMEALTAPVFEFSELCIRKRGGSLPHGAVLSGHGQIVLVGASIAGATTEPPLFRRM